jgi:beta-glucosidase
VHRYQPASDSEADRAACQRVQEKAAWVFGDPIFLGEYPESLIAWIGSHAPRVQQGDMDLIGQPIDFLGVNHYFTALVSESYEGGLFKAVTEHISAPGWGHTEMGWGINPSGLTAVLLDIKDRYGNPRVYVTENGCALEDFPNADGFVTDWGRVGYLRCYLRAVHDAIQAGADVAGYYAWSLMDNFEWHHGYWPRFGIVRVDFETGKRTPKQSALWYSEVIGRNGVEI